MVFRCAWGIEGEGIEPSNELCSGTARHTGSSGVKSHVSGLCSGLAMNGTCLIQVVRYRLRSRYRSPFGRAVGGGLRVRLLGLTLSPLVVVGNGVALPTFAEHGWCLALLTSLDAIYWHQVTNQKVGGMPKNPTGGETWCGRRRYRPVDVARPVVVPASGRAVRAPCRTGGFGRGHSPCINSGTDDSRMPQRTGRPRRC